MISSEKLNIDKFFYFSSLNCGIKKNGKPDLSIIIVPDGVEVYGFFTTNKIRSYTVERSERILKERRNIRAVLVISGNAICCGERDEEDVEEIAGFLSKEINAKKEEVIILATGKIGVPLEKEKVIKKIPEIVKIKKNYKAFAKGILTTDKVLKISEYTDGGIYALGIAKGAGMIYPNLATTLSFVFINTQAIERNVVLDIISRTLSAINVDGCQSTNDTNLCFFLNKIYAKEEDISRALENVYSQIAEKIVEDGEGVRHVAKITVEGARTKKDAEIVARAISNSLLFKASMSGASPDFGRVLASIGSTQVDFGKISIHIKNKKENDEVEIVKDTKIIYKNLKKAKKIMKNKRYIINVNLGVGTEKFSILSSDISPQYIKINQKM